MYTGFHSKSTRRVYTCSCYTTSGIRMHIATETIRRRREGKHQDYSSAGYAYASVSATLGYVSSYFVSPDPAQPTYDEADDDDDELNQMEKEQLLDLLGRDYIQGYSVNNKGL